MERFDNAHTVLFPTFPGFADAAVIEFDGGVRCAVPSKKPDGLAESADAFVLEDSHFET
jgi:hypothetical protein